jgi:hypothetical protein
MKTNSVKYYTTTYRLGAITKNVSSSVFFEVKRNKKCIENRF